MIMKILLLAALLFFCMSNTATVKYAVREAVMRCIDTVIPSLYGMMILSSLIVSSGILSRIPTFAALIGRKLFGMEKTVFPIFIFSLFAGYPVGANALQPV